MKKGKRILAFLLSFVISMHTFLMDLPETAFADILDFLSPDIIENMSSDYISKNLNSDIADLVSSMTGKFVDDNSHAVLTPDQERELSLSQLGVDTTDLDRIKENDLQEEDYVSKDEYEDTYSSSETADKHGLLSTYHYIKLHYTLVDKAYVYEGITVDGMYANCPEGFIADYTSMIPVYLSPDGEYYVALVDVGRLQGTGNAIFAQFSDGDIRNPLVFNDVLKYDYNTGLLYIPKSFYYNENGEEIIRPLATQLLVPYSMTDSISNVEVTVNDGNTEKTETIQTATLDTTISIPLGTDAELSQLDVYVNNETIPRKVDSTNASITDGVLELNASGINTYAVDIEINDKSVAMDDITADVLVAFEGNISELIGPRIAKDTTWVTNISSIKTLPGVTVKGNFSTGDHFSYTGYTFQNADQNSTDSRAKHNADVLNNLRKALLPYSYRAYADKSQTIAGNYSGSGAISSIVTASGTIPNETIGLVDPVDAMKINDGLQLFAELPSGTKGNSTWTVNLGVISGYPKFSTAGDALYTNYAQTSRHTAEDIIASTCAGITSSSLTGSSQSTSVFGSSSTLYAKCLYVDSAHTTSVWSVMAPSNGAQAFSAIIRVATEPGYYEYHYTLGAVKQEAGYNSEHPVAVFAVGTDAAKVNAASTSAVASASSAQAAANLLASDLTYIITSGDNKAAYCKDYFSFLSEETDITKIRKKLYVKEVWADSKYTLNGNVYWFTITPDKNDPYASSIYQYGYYKIPDSVTSDYTTNNGTANMRSFYFDDNPRYYTGIGVQKVDGNGKPLVGVQFAVYIDNASNYITTISTDSYGWAYYKEEVSSSGEKTYYVKEVGPGLVTSNGVSYIKLNNRWYIADTNAYAVKSVAQKYSPYSDSQCQTHSRKWENEEDLKDYTVYKKFNENTEDTVKSVTIQLVRQAQKNDGSWTPREVIGTVVLNKANKWTYTWNNLAVHYLESQGTNTANFLTYHYYVEEIGAVVQEAGKPEQTLGAGAVASWFDIVYDNEGWEIVDKTNITNNVTTSHTANKVFADKYTEDSITQIMTTLYYVDESMADGEKATYGNVYLRKDGAYWYDQGVLTKISDTPWKYTWNNLPYYSAGGYIRNYFAEEILVYYLDANGNEQSIATSASIYKDLFKSSSDNDGTDRKIETNFVDEKILKHTFTKAYEGDYAEDYIESITVQLHQNGQPFGDTVKLTNKTQNFAYTWDELPKYDADGNAYTYTVSEIEVNGISDVAKYYIVTTIESNTELTLVTNESYTEKAYATKVMDATTDSFVKSVTINLLKDGEIYRTHTFDTSENLGTYNFSFENLPTYNADASECKYEIVEAGITFVQNGKTYELTSLDDVKKYFYVETANIESEDGEVFGQIVNTATQLYLTKTDFVNGRDVIGARLQLVDANGGIYVEWISGDTENPLIHTGDDGRTYLALECIPVGTYTFREITAPDGYEKAEDVIVVVEETAEIQKADMIDYRTPKGKTTATDTSSGSKVVTEGKEAKITDVLKYKYLIPGVEYEAVGTIMIVEDNAPLLDKDGKPVVSKATFVPTSKTDGEVTINFEFDYELLKALEGEKIVIFEDVYREDKTIIVEHNINDKPQTLIVPKIGTTAKDEKTGAKVVARDEKAVVLDTVEYTLEAGKTYEMRGVLMLKDSEKKLLDKDGKEITSVERFTIPESTAGSIIVTSEIEVKFEFDSTVLSGEKLTVFEYCYLVELDTDDKITKETLVKSHEEYSAEQSVSVPEIHTTFTDVETGTHTAEYGDNVTVKDSVKYENLPIAEYTITGVLYRKDTKQPLLDENGKEIIASKTFTNTSENGEVEIEFTLNSKLLSIPGKEIVAFEYLEYIDGGITVAIHTDIESKPQTIVIKKYGQVELYKTDEDGNKIEGVTYTVYADKECTKEITSVTTGKEGYGISKEIPAIRYNDEQNIEAIKYYLKETSAPAGIALDDTVEEFTFAEDEKAEVLTKTFTKVDKIQKGKIAVVKKGLLPTGVSKVETAYGVDVNKLVIEYKFLEGAEFTIYSDKECTKAVSKIKTSKDGLAESEYLKVGTYYVKETSAPYGFAIDEESYEIEIKGEKNGPEYVIDVTKDVEDKLLSTSLTISKVGMGSVNATEEKPLKGVIFGVFAAEDLSNIVGDLIVKKDTCIALIKTNKDGIATMTDTLLAGKYYYKELKTANDHYVLDSTKYNFEVSYEKSDDVKIEKKAVNYEIVPGKGSFIIKKRDQFGNLLVGAEFTIKNKDTGEEIGKIIIGENGEGKITDLPTGYYDDNDNYHFYTYTYQEIKGPNPVFNAEGKELPIVIDDAVYEFSFAEEDSVFAEGGYSMNRVVTNQILGIEDYVKYGFSALALLLAVFFGLQVIREIKKKYKT